MTKHTACQRRPVLATLCLMAFVLLVLAFDTLPAVAADYSWANPVSGDFDGPTNWTPAGGPPGANDTAIFNLGSTGYTVSSTLADTLQQLRVDNDTVTFQSISGRSLSATGTTLPAISFGNNAGDIANVTLKRSLTGVNDAVGYAAGSQATATLLGTSWTDTNLYIGYAGQGTVNLPNSSSLSSTNSMVLGYQAGSQGTVTQSGAGIGLQGGSLIVGGSGAGTLSAVRASFNQIILGQNTGSTGTATVGSVETESGGNLVVGQNGNGSMSLISGGSVSGALVIGQNVGSQGTTSLTNSHSFLTVYGIRGEPSVIVGGSGQGSLSLSNAATLNSGPMVVGQSVGSVGEVDITGAKSRLDASDLEIGNAGKGTLTVSAGGNAEAQNLSIATTAGASGAISVDGAGSSVIGNGELTIASSGIGSLAITNGGSVDAKGSTTVGANTSSQGGITVDGAGSILRTGDLTTAGAGHGNIAVTAGGELDGGTNVIGRDHDSHGSISIDGAQSTFLLAGAAIGQAGQGSLTLSGGSLTTAKGDMIVGQAATGVGTLTVDGAMATVQNLVVAQDGIGAATFSNGANVTAQNVTIGADKGANGSISVTGSGTALTAWALSIAPAGSGQLSASDGAAVSATSVTIGGAGSLSLVSGATLISTDLTISPLGQLSLAGAGTKYSVPPSNGPLQIAGVATISNGASWITPTAVEVGNLAANPASVTVSGAGSQWNASSTYGSLTLAAASQLAVNNSGAVTASTIVDEGAILVNTGATLSATNSLGVLGILQVGTGASVITPSLSLFQGRTVDLSGGGTVIVGATAPTATVLDSFTTNAAPSGSLIQIETGGHFTTRTDVAAPFNGIYSVTGSILNQGGTVNLQGESLPSQLDVSGDFTQQSGTLALLMIGSTSNASNELHVAGNVSLSGELELDIASSQESPVHAGATFDLIFAAGNFDTSGLTVVAKGAFGVPLPAGFAYTTQLSDGVFSMTVTSVPEPSTLVLTGLCALGVVLRRRRASIVKKVIS
ncbi:MAG TPA: PEP-CTERM sorting domain-containing protein [Pirellulales bacterium]